MVAGRVLAASPVVVLLMLAAPVPAAATHCGWDVIVTPTTGRAGTTFVLETRVPVPVDDVADTPFVVLHLEQDDTFRGTFELTSRQAQRYEIRTGPEDVGHWEAQVRPRGVMAPPRPFDPECWVGKSFWVTAMPDTATGRRASASTSFPLALVAAASLAGAASMAHRLRQVRRQPMPSNAT